MGDWAQMGKVLIVDNKIDPPFGSADLVRYLGANVDVFRAPEGKLPEGFSMYSHMVISGSKTSCMAQEPWLDKLLALIQLGCDKNLPIFGVCFGHQLIARALGGVGVLRRSPTPEFGWVEINAVQENAKNDPVFSLLPQSFFSFASHFEEVTVLPEGFIPMARNSRCQNQAYRVKGKPVFGVQFHPERNAEEGEQTYERIKGKVPVDIVFNEGKTSQCYDSKLAVNLFTRFLNIGG
jgi:GMP synthase-like glutamine amidotransferase